MEGDSPNQEIRRPITELPKQAESGYLTQTALGRILDLEQTDRLLRRVGSTLPVERKIELDKSLSLHLEQNIGSNIDPVKSLTDPEEKSRMQNFLSKWDQLPPTVKGERISAALKLLSIEELDQKALEQERRQFQQHVFTDHDRKNPSGCESIVERRDGRVG